MNLLESFLTRFLILRIRRGYGFCDGTEPECIACRAQKTVIFLKEHLELLKT